MLGVYAGAISTDVVNGHPGRNGAPKFSVGNPMSKRAAVSAVSIAVKV